MKPMNKAIEFRIRYEDGSELNLSAYDIDKIEALGESIQLIERARRVYQTLKPFFKRDD